jgi:hypothetical protein
MVEFIEFPKISRLSRDVIVTEKIDGTNGTIYIGEDGLEFLVGSSTRWITPDCDNHGFARWAYDNHDELLKLGPGWHRGEWWGSGIQRGYGLPKSEKRFSLFNTIRWCWHDEEPERIETQDPRIEKYQERLPKCCGLVPVLYKGIFNTWRIEELLVWLEKNGSYAAPGYLKPEGIVVFHIAGNVGFKKTIGSDGHKGSK